MSLTSSLDYGVYDFSNYGYIMPPPPKLNGGLYTGTPFNNDAGYSTVKVIPDVDYMMNINLKSAKGVSEAQLHYPGNNRPGNSIQDMTGLQRYSNNNDILCISDSVINSMERPDEKVKRVMPYDLRTSSHSLW